MPSSPASGSACARGCSPPRAAGKTGWEDRRLGDLAAIAIGLQALARLLSIVMHGTPAPSFTSAMIGEMVTAVVILQGGSLVENRA